MALVPRQAVNNDAASLYYIIEDLPEVGGGVHAPLFPIKTHTCSLFPEQWTKVFPEIYFSSVPMFPEIVLLVPLIRPFSIVLVNLAFNATRNSRIKSKNAKIMPDFFK